MARRGVALKLILNGNDAYAPGDVRCKDVRIAASMRSRHRARWALISSLLAASEVLGIGADSVLECVALLRA
jgi:hypothetical protein